MKDIISERESRNYARTGEYVSDPSTIEERLETLESPEIIIITGTTHTLGIKDLDSYLRCTNSGATTITIPANLIPIGRSISIEKVGGNVAVIGSGVTVNGKLTTTGTNTILVLMSVGVNEITCIGGDS